MFLKPACVDMNLLPSKRSGKKPGKITLQILTKDQTAFDGVLFLHSLSFLFVATVLPSVGKYSKFFSQRHLNKC